MNIEDLIDEAIADYEKSLKDSKFGPDADKAAARVRDLLAERRERGYKRR